MRSLRLLLVAGLVLAGGSSISCNKNKDGMMENMNFKPNHENQVTSKSPVPAKRRLPAEPDRLEAPPIKR